MEPITARNPSKDITLGQPEDPSRRKLLRSLAGSIAAAGAMTPLASALAQETGSTGRLEPFRANEAVETGHRFFGTVTRGLAGVVEEASRRWGQPNGYILGQEASGAFIGGLRFGEGTLYTRSAGNFRAYWQGPSFGADFGGDGARTMMLVYNLKSVPSLYQRFGGADGSAYFIGGFGMTALFAGDTTLVPIRSGVGARLGLNISYLKFTTEPTWNPF
jgi:hypothetical protein